MGRRNFRRPAGVCDQKGEHTFAFFGALVSCGGKEGNRECLCER